MSGKPEYRLMYQEFKKIYEEFLEKYDIAGIKGKTVKDIVYEWRRRWFKEHPRKKPYLEKQLERMKRHMEMLKYARENP